MPEIELKDEFLSDGVREDELKTILSQGDAHGDGDTYSYFGDQVVVKYSKTGKILSICGDPKKALVQTALRNIQEAILTDHGTRVARSIVLSTVPITGSYRFGDRFQILPLDHQSNYGPTIGHGDHPAILEVQYPVSPNDLLDSERSTRNLRKIARFLNLVSRWGISYPASYTTWVRVPRAWKEPSPAERGLGETKLQPSLQVDAMHINTGYSVDDDFQVISEDFSDLVDPPVQIIDTDEYYGALGISPDELFCLPEAINEFCNSYFNLFDIQDQFDRALYWYSISQQVGTFSASLSFVSLIQSIETMCDSEPESFNCEECGDQVLFQTPCNNCGRIKKTQGPTRLFREFVDQYAPNLPGRVRGEMYSLRSSITHGSALMVTDEDLSGFQFDRKRVDQRSLSYVARSVAQTSLLNWLVS